VGYLSHEVAVEGGALLFSRVIDHSFERQKRLNGERYAKLLFGQNICRTFCVFSRKYNNAITLLTQITLLVIKKV
jgi:hypothetical protein